MREEERMLKSMEGVAQGVRLRLGLLGGWWLLLWGGIYAVGNLLLALDPGLGGRFWALAGPLGTLFTFGLGFRLGHRVQSPLGLQIFALWSLLVLFALLHWLPLLPPLDLEGTSFIASLVAFGVALSGVVVRAPAFLWGGVLFFLYDLLLYRLLPGLFYPGMALLGLGLFLLGAYLVWRWTR